MRLHVLHRTVYRYSAPIHYAIQTLRLQPRPYEGLTVLNWRVEGDGHRPLPSFIDGLGNIVHCHSVDRPHTEASITVEGEVETRRGDGIVLETPEPLPPLFYLRVTPLTAADEAIKALARSATGNSTLERLHAIMNTVRDRVGYRPGTTDTQTAAAEALAQGEGVCQDHAHLFIAAARAVEIPARYIGGYLWTESEAEYDAAHAWAEAYVPDLGWVGFDAANRICPTENYIRVSVGLDYWAAAPVRGLRRGAAEESLDVRVKVRQPGADQQQ
jgi:transglutaminase-like putative cysteine protease